MSGDLAETMSTFLRIGWQTFKTHSSTDILVKTWRSIGSRKNNINTWLKGKFTVQYSRRHFCHLVVKMFPIFALTGTLWAFNVYCMTEQCTSPPLKSSGRSAGGGSRSPAGSGDASTASLFAPCPEDAACSQTAQFTCKRAAALKQPSLKKEESKVSYSFLRRWLLRVTMPNKTSSIFFIT